MVELHHFRYFLAVVDHGGINAAAAALELAKPTVGQAIRELERELDVQLFQRLGRGMVPTSAGYAFIGPAKRVLRDVTAAQGALPDAAGQLHGRLEMVVSPALSTEPTARLVSEFRQAHPKVFVRIGHLHDEDASASLIREGHCEIVICHLPMPESDGLGIFEMGSQEDWVVFPPGTVLPPDDPLPLAALPDIPMVTVPRGGFPVSQIEQAIAEVGRLRPPATVLAHREARLSFVLAGVGGSFLERSIAEAGMSRGLVARATKPALKRQYGLAYDESALSPAGQAFLTMARASAPGR